MKFHCSGCQSTFSIPDDKIPEGKGLRILCPKCRKPVERSSPAPASSGAESAESAAGYQGFETAEGYDESAPLDLVEEGVRTSLLCTSDGARSALIDDTLRGLDFYVSSAATPKLALDKLRNNHYDLVILDELYGGSRLSENLVLHHVQFVPMHTRRRFFLCLVSETLPTLDQMAAFRIGVDIILNVRDIDKLKLILVRAMKDNKSFYKVFSSELERKGEA